VLPALGAFFLYNLFSSKILFLFLYIFLFSLSVSLFLVAADVLSGHSVAQFLPIITTNIFSTLRGQMIRFKSFFFSGRVNLSSLNIHSRYVIVLGWYRTGFVPSPATWARERREGNWFPLTDVQCRQTFAQAKWELSSLCVVCCGWPLFSGKALGNSVLVPALRPPPLWNSGGWFFCVLLEKKKVERGSKVVRARRPWKERGEMFLKLGAAERL
jgi:hypothetical protein